MSIDYDTPRTEFVAATVPQSPDEKEGENVKKWTVRHWNGSRVGTNQRTGDYLEVYREYGEEEELTGW